MTEGTALYQAIMSGQSHEAIEKWRDLLFYRYKAVVQLLIKKGPTSS